MRENQQILDNRSNQLNPNNATYYSSRGYDDDDECYPCCSYYRKARECQPQKSDYQLAEERMIAGNKQSVIANMNPNTAADLLLVPLNDKFPDLSFKNISSKTNIIFEVKGCKSERQKTAELIDCLTILLQERWWKFQYCVQKLELHFDEDKIITLSLKTIDHAISAEENAEKEKAVVNINLNVPDKPIQLPMAEAILAFARGLSKA